MTDAIRMLKKAGNGRHWMGGLLGLSLALGLFATPLAAGSTQHVQQAANYFALQPYDAEFIVLVDAAIRRAPSAEAEAVATLVGGMRVKTTAMVAGAGWFRVSLESGESGFVEERFLRNADEDAAPGAKAGGQVAALPRQNPVELFRDCKNCPNMVRLDPGNYVMGSNDHELTEAPAHSVAIGYSFALGQHEVTVAEWMHCVAASACTYDPKATAGSATSAVRNISWEDAQEYLRWLGQLTGKPYRLPSEAEWEYAARSGSTTSYWWGNEMTPGYADCKDCGDQWKREAPAPVNKYRDNPRGLYGMTGGVAEWTADCWSRSYKNAPTDGSAHKRPGCKKRVLRGGSWRDDTEQLRSSARKPHEVNIPSTRHGLRVALTLQ